MVLSTGGGKLSPQNTELPPPPKILKIAIAPYLPSFPPPKKKKIFTLLHFSNFLDRTLTSLEWSQL